MSTSTHEPKPPLTGPTDESAVAPVVGGRPGGHLLRERKVANGYGRCGFAVSAVRALEGQLTATLHGTDADLAAFGDLISVLEGKAGRLLVNGFPTGVEVCHAMVHGGPFPATSDSRHTSVGTQAIYRFARPVCYQDFPQAALPAELKNENPLEILRLVDGVFTREAL